MIQLVVFDIDGTLTDDVEFTVKEFLNAYRIRYGKEYTKKIDYSIYPPENMFDSTIDDKEFLEKFKKDLWDKILNANEVPIRKHMIKLTNDLHAKGIKVHIVTARMSGGYEDDYEDLDKKETIIKRWLTTNGFYFDSFHFGIHEKINQLASIGCDCLVDDSPEQALNVSKKFKVFLVDTPYNKLIKGNNIWRFYADDFETETFLKKAEYADNHSEVYLEEADTYTDKLNDKYALSGNNIIYRGEGNKNLTFVIPARQRNMDIENITLDILSKYPSIKVLRLSLLSNPNNKSANANVSKGDNIVIAAFNKVWGRYLREQKEKLKNYKSQIDFLNDSNSTTTYMFKVDVIKEILKYVKSHNKEKFIMDGMEIMMLARDEVKPYEKYPVIITSCTEKDFSIIKKKINKPDYNVFLLLEDLSDVSTQLRKWRIISGTASKDLPTFINRQYSDSDGVDRVHLLDGEKPYRPDILDSILSMDTYLISDIHISSKDPEKTKNIIRNVNAKVSPNEHLLILGDMDGKKGSSTWKLIRDTIHKFRTNNIYLILGNNDQYSIDEYVKMGFLSVTDEAVLKESGMGNIIFTHCPVPVSNDDINIHGHIHGSKCYWNVDWHNHYDIWDQDFYPIKVRECLEILEKGLYQARTEIHKNY